MSDSAMQAKIDSITWYHQFDFGNGLRTKDNSPDARFHQLLSDFMTEQLDAVPFQGKSVLDIGCWNGYWSFYAERRGAAEVLASDDFSQNWSDTQGFFLARELLGSAVEINPRLSVYDLANLGRKFDVILFLGVYYHLWDPFFALAQIRHCCHPGSVVLIDGPYDPLLPPGASYINTDVPTSKFTPSIGGLKEMLAATYFHVDSQRDLQLPPAAPSPAPQEAPQEMPPSKPDRLGWRWRLRMCLEALKGSRNGIQRMSDILFPTRSVPEETPSPSTTGQQRAFERTFLVCTPFEGENQKHQYMPPFGLQQYDSRFNAEIRPAA